MAKASASTLNTTLKNVLPFYRLASPQTHNLVPAPIKATTHAAAFDCFAASREFYRARKGELHDIEPHDARQFDLIKYSTGTVFEIPENHVGLAFARSSICKMPLILANGTGVIDSDFRGELCFIFRILDAEDISETSYQLGQRIGQLLIVTAPALELIETTKLSPTSRGSGAFGSTGL